jgi:hypothetical protein
MGLEPQSQQGAGWSLPTPAELQRPLASPLLGAESNDANLAGEKLPAGAPGQNIITGYHAKFSEELHNYVRDQIRNADQKATFFFAALTAMLAFLNTQGVPTRWIKDVRHWTFVDALGFVSTVALAAGAVILLGVVFPRLKGSRRGLLFFNAVAEYDSSAQYAEDVLGRSEEELVRTKLQHCYDLSKVCGAKYRMLSIGFWIGSVGAAAALLFMLLAKSGA